MNINSKNMVAVLKLGANLIGLIYVYYKRYVGVCFKKRCIGEFFVFFFSLSTSPHLPITTFCGVQQKIYFLLRANVIDQKRETGDKIYAPVRYKGY